MLATPDTIWSVPAYLPYLQPALTSRAVAAAEKQIGYKLPPTYLNLLRKQNGGYIRFSLPKMVHSLIAGIGPEYPSITDVDWEECAEHVSFELQGLVPFDGDGHWHICLDYRKKGHAPAITYVDIECDRESHVSDSFEDYLSKLRIKVDGKYVIEAVSDIELLKAELSRQLRTKFDPPDTWAHGYPTWRAELGSKAQLWISPNTVRRGFVRESEHRYAELKDLMAGLSDRYPGLPPNSYILSMTDGATARVLDACRRSGLAVKPLHEYFA